MRLLETQQFLHDEAFQIGLNIRLDRHDMARAELGQTPRVDAFQRAKLDHTHAIKAIGSAKMACGEYRALVILEIRAASLPFRIEFRQVRRPASGEQIDCVGGAGWSRLKLSGSERRSACDVSLAQGGKQA